MYKNIQVNSFKEFNNKIPMRSKTIDIVFLSIMFLVLTSPLMIFLVSKIQNKSNNIELMTTLKTVNSNLKKP